MKYFSLKLSLVLMSIISIETYSEIPKNGWIFKEILSTEIKILNSLKEVNLQEMIVDISEEDLKKLLTSCTCRYLKKESTYRIENIKESKGADNLKAIIVFIADSQVIELTYRFNDGQSIGQQSLKSK